MDGEALRRATSLLAVLPHPAKNERLPLLDFGPIAARQEKWQHPLYVRVAAHWPLSIYQLYPFQR
jgi:hypothetical protein